MQNFLIYQASAGSGKTYTLVKEYLRLALLYPRSYRNILAVTFTNKATEEMKSRVILKLSELSQGKDSELASVLEKEIAEITGGKRKVDVKQSAAEVLENILHDYSSFSVSTIDSFSVRIVRSFAKELRIPFGFSLEMDSPAVLDEITETLLDKVGSDDELTKYISRFIEMSLEDLGNWRIEQSIRELGYEIFRERYWNKKLSLSTEDIYANKEEIHKLVDEIRKVKYTFENFLKKKSEEMLNIIEENGLSSADFVQKGRGVWAFMTEKLLARNYKDSPFYSKAQSGIENFIDKKAFSKSSVKSAVEAGLYDIFSEAYGYMVSNLTEYNTADRINRTIYITGIFWDLLKELDKYRAENRVLLASDLNNILRTLISQDISPFIYEKIGSAYRNFLIDEFQDTSLFQWMNLKPLLVNALSENNYVMLVGDVKQSLYRWRGGDMKLLLNQVYDDFEPFRERISTRTLGVNRRSQKAIVEFNNKFFTELLKFADKGVEPERYQNLVTAAYSKGVVQDVLPEKSRGYVRAEIFDRQEELEHPKIRAGKRTAEIISEVLDDGYSPKDILILVRTAADGISISSVVASEGHKVISSESLLVRNSPKIKLIVNILKYITDNRNYLAKTEILYLWLEYLKDAKAEPDEIFGDFKTGKGELFAKSLPPDFFRSADESKIRSVLYDLSLYEVIELIIDIFGLNSVPDPYLLKFQDAAFDYTGKFDSDITSFLRWWEEKKGEFSITIPEGLDAIQVMTIHKAKGLQNRVVIIPYADWDVNIKSGRDFVWVSTDKPPFNKAGTYYVTAAGELADTYFNEDYQDEYALTRIDNMNLMYVAFTRPEERLYINAPQKGTLFTAHKLIKSVLEGTPEFSENLDNSVYESGEKLKASEYESRKKSETEIISAEIQKFNSNEWYRRTIILPAYKKLKALGKKDFALKTNRGVILHEILSFIRVREDIDEAVFRAAASGMIKESEADAYRKLAENVLDDDRVSNWFSDEWEVKAESEILLKNGAIYRPDRVLTRKIPHSSSDIRLSPEKRSSSPFDCIVIDYKTGNENEGHKLQVKKYGEALEKMGYKKVGKYLLYINESEGCINNVVQV